MQAHLQKRWTCSPRSANGPISHDMHTYHTLKLIHSRQAEVASGGVDINIHATVFCLKLLDVYTCLPLKWDLVEMCSLFAYHSTFFVILDID